MADFLVSASSLVNREPETTARSFRARWARGPPESFDAFPSEAGCDAHLSGEVAKALMAGASDLFVKLAANQ